MTETGKAREAAPAMLRLTYASLANLVVAQMGEPGLAHLIPLEAGLVGYFRRTDILDMVGFEIHEFSERFPELDRDRLVSILGSEIVESLDQLFESMPAPSDLDSLSEEGFVEALSKTHVRLEARISAPSPQVREARLEALLSWRLGTREAAVSASARGTQLSSDWQPKRRAPRSSQRIAAGTTGTEPSIDSQTQGLSAHPEQGEHGDLRVNVRGDKSVPAGSWVQLETQSRTNLLAPLRWHDRRNCYWASLLVADPVAIRGLSAAEAIRSPASVRESVRRANRWTRTSWRRALEELASRDDVPLRFVREAEEGLGE